MTGYLSALKEIALSLCSCWHTYIVFLNLGLGSVIERDFSFSKQ